MRTLVAIVCAVVVFCVLVLSEPIAANAVIPTTERSDLISLYSSTNGNHWYVNTKWCIGNCPSTGTPVFNAPGTECTWYGVKCDSNGTHVIGINLSKNQLTGQIPKFAGFTDLQYFDGSVNQLTGTIPDLTNLQGIDVHNNRLTGQIPTLATNFQLFDASSNQLTGKIPDLTELTDLQGFVVDNNQLTGSIPTLARLTNLRNFGASSNQLTGEIPDLTGLTSLEGFSVHDNHLTGPIPALARLTKLKIFNVSYNQLTGKIPDLTELISLQYFEVSDNQLSGSVPAAPTSLIHASLCPNPLTIARQPDIDPVWNKATGATPWWTKLLMDSTCGSGQTPLGTTAAAQTPAGAQPSLDERALALKASLAATGNDYPTPAMFVKRWNLLAQSAPQAQITKFTSKGHESDPRPIAELGGFDFARAERTYLQIGSSGASIEYVTIRDDPLNVGAKEQPDSYSITISGNQKKDFGQLCIWVIRSTRSSFTFSSAIQLFADVAHNKPPSNATLLQNHAEAEGISLILRKNSENLTCEVKKTAGK